VTIEDIQLRDTNPEPSEVSAKNQKHQEIRQAIGQLRNDYQEVLVLRFLNDLSPNETAEVMKRSTGAIRVLQHRAIVALRKTMEEQHEQRI
jgi:RNA polymerase sigma-70 factor (ECF subfamily)